MKGWHYAPREVRGDIEAHGLDWRRSPAAQRPQDPRNQAPVANYFSPSRDVAEQMDLSGYDLYEVDLSGVSTTPDPYQPQDAFYTLDAIEPSKIRRVASEDYRGHHRAPTSADDVAAPFHDVEEMMPDYYAHPEYYSHDGRNSAVSRESEVALKAARGKPDAMVTIYRALPPGITRINPGDWVTQSLTYARQHAVSNGGDDWPVITVQVPAKSLWTEGYVCEWGYSGSSISARQARMLPSATAAAVDNDYSDSVMLCLKPSDALLKTIADMDECTEDLDDLHVTLFYFGSTDDVGGEAGRERIYRGLYDFAINSGYRGLTGTMQGFGVFQNEESDVLVGLFDIPGISDFRTHLMTKVREHGVETRVENHGFVPHLTLSYDDDRVVKIPRVPPSVRSTEEHFISVWLAWGDEWTEVTLS